MSSPAPAGRQAAPGAQPPVVQALVRHFCDLRDGRHGDAASRQGKEALFRTAVELLDPYARQVLQEFNTHLMLDTGQVEATGVVRTADRSLAAAWTLSWPEQRAQRIAPVTLHAFYGSGFHHPHLRGATVADWPLNVFTAQQAADEVPTLRAIAASDLHNLVFQRTYEIVPVITGGPRAAGGVEEGGRR
ncbi:MULTISPECIES: hypothetical protein [Streptomycetaceae]|uniref:Uncharacterized protein n=1 Tax=Streptantibioticus cattleyicolor (strain ATCC 35852 / DSM 46488 / JCM 4925 / NBRC 14057 / NRRL 8057) TaxID=1003195 RepID=F8JV14_STREN|nr:MULTISPECIES: hypothetical protein [Streptomycetaceae]AEW98182.1 hypothetical protein SCATT_58110 [Streptantibioticus cattleyicolor NRRL 8057 = DSM 46488]MYS62566.1 hypothetical protein [Streptomyces sp. SID5468]CCB78498.1 conserved protein of unknown function [Streptantibioticus cattleyicolor NRRL 8057 = DSM 46488]